MNTLTTPHPDFSDITRLIDSVRQHAYQAVNTTLIELYWQVGAHLSHKIAAVEWGEGIVDQLAQHLASTQPGLKGFTRANLFRMRQFYEAHHAQEKVAPLVRQLPWTHSRSLSPALVAQYQTQLPDKKLLQAKLHEFYLANVANVANWGEGEGV